MQSISDNFDVLRQSALHHQLVPHLWVFAVDKIYTYINKPSVGLDRTCQLNCCPICFQFHLVSYFRQFLSAAHQLLLISRSPSTGSGCRDTRGKWHVNELLRYLCDLVSSLSSPRSDGRRPGVDNFEVGHSNESKVEGAWCD